MTTKLKPYSYDELKKQINKDWSWERLHLEFMTSFKKGYLEKAPNGGYYYAFVEGGGTYYAKTQAEVRQQIYKE